MKFIVRYTNVEYYEKVYEAESEDAAVEAYYNDDKLFESGPYESGMEIVEVCEAGSLD